MNCVEPPPNMLRDHRLVEADEHLQRKETEEVEEHLKSFNSADLPFLFSLIYQLFVVVRS